MQNGSKALGHATNTFCKGERSYSRIICAMKSMVQLHVLESSYSNTITQAGKNRKEIVKGRILKIYLKAVHNLLCTYEQLLYRSESTYLSELFPWLSIDLLYIHLMRRGKGDIAASAVVWVESFENQLSMVGCPEWSILLNMSIPNAESDELDKPAPN